MKKNTITQNIALGSLSLIFALEILSSFNGISQSIIGLPEFLGVVSTTINNKYPSGISTDGFISIYLLIGTILSILVFISSLLALVSIMTSYLRSKVFIILAIIMNLLASILFATGVFYMNGDNLSFLGTSTFIHMVILTAFLIWVAMTRNNLKLVSYTHGT